MAIRRRSVPDDFQNPTPHSATSKSTVNRVLSRAVSGGNTLLSLLAGLMAAVMILYSGFVLYDTFYLEASAASSSFNVLEYRPEILDDVAIPLAGETTLATVNEDYRAWLTMYGSAIDYPVMQGTDDLYYASHDIYRQTSLTGAIYAAAANSSSFSDSYNLIYGHHMDNGAMFGGLDNYTSESYYEANREGMLVSSSGVYDLTTFAVVLTDAYESQVYTVGNRLEEVRSFLRDRYAASDGKTTVLYLDDAVLSGATQIVALSTCMNAQTSGRLLVFASMTRRNLMTVDAQGYEGIYDARSHGLASITANYPDGTIYSYSLDGGATWVEGLPQILNVGQMNVLIRAENENYGTAYTEVTLVVTPKPVTVQVANAFKVFGAADPAWQTQSVEGIIDGFVPVYTIQRVNEGTEDVGTYTGVLQAEGATLQGNYSITYLPGDFTITASDVLVLTAVGYSGVYDGNAHGLTALDVNITDGTLIEYSIDGGVTFTTTAPEITDVGSIDVVIRASNPNYDPVTITVTLEVTPRVVTVTARPATKAEGEDDPVFEVTVEGLLGNDTIVYTVSRPGSGSQEANGVYEGAIVPSGEEFQGNYQVVYVPADFTIEEVYIIEPEPEPPLAHFVEKFDPRPSLGKPAWALVNLICLIVTVYLFLPLLHLKAKFGRGKAMKKFNTEKMALTDKEELNETELLEKEIILETSADDVAGAVDKLYYHVKKFVRKFRIGSVLELVNAVLAIILFVLTEDMRLPMVLIDKWTPFMIVLMLMMWGLDLYFMRYRDKLEAEEKLEEKLNENSEKVDGMA